MSVVQSEEPEQSEDRVDAFVFVREIEPPQSFRDVVDLLRERYGEVEDGPIVFISEFLGDFRICVHVARPTLGEIQDFIGKELWEAGVHSEHAVEKKPTVSPLGPIRRSPKPPHLAVVRVDLEPGASPGEVFGAIESMGFEKGLDTYASVVYGDFDMLLEIGGDQDSFQGVLALEGELDGVDGVARTTSAIAYVSP